MCFVVYCVNHLLYLCACVTGGTNEGDHSDSPSVRKCLRKTRGELLLREYEVLVLHALLCLVCFPMFIIYSRLEKKS